MKLDIDREKELQEIVELVARICGTPTALITLIAEDLQHIKFKIGFDKSTTRRQDAFCNHVIEQKGVMIVPDATKDLRFVDNTLVTGHPNIRFYAGAPLTTSDGHSLGSLCVIDREPRELSPLQEQMLAALAKQVIQLLEFDASVQILKQQFIDARESENKLRSFFESSSSCHLLLNRDMEIVVFNKAVENFLRAVKDAELRTGAKMIDFIDPSLIPVFHKNFKKALAGKVTTIERMVDYKHGKMWWSITFDPARNAAGEIIGVSYHASDITRRVEKEKQVQAQNDSLRHIAFMQSHELRRPVASISGIMNLIKAGNYGADKELYQLMEAAVNELDEKIKLIVNETLPAN
ncbi:GAF domain-containing protein [Hufsiella ginkgonis]|uniref:GAF domain-containing protein n=1 Tax=Hufsiella ginkgonis TaxID=2695274 RepID=A0A7K1XZ54_9SPHI|nr:GAF domain-containing protein [Hufsiella ginkgonis]MXV16019.1 GAF domain-containing protein [Hufsiella ginkgonis]